MDSPNVTMRIDPPCRTSRQERIEHPPQRKATPAQPGVLLDSTPLRDAGSATPRRARSVSSANSLTRHALPGAEGAGELWFPGDRAAASLLQLCAQDFESARFADDQHRLMITDGRWKRRQAGAAEKGEQLRVLIVAPQPNHHQANVR